MSRGHPQPIECQISIRGRGVEQLSHGAAVELVERMLDEHELPERVRVRVQIWRAGKEIGDWRNEPIEDNFWSERVRRFLQDPRLRLSLRDRE